VSKGQWSNGGFKVANLPTATALMVVRVASGTTNATGKMDLKQSHAHFAKINLNQEGVLDEAAA
jgi:hypothetical protein